MSNENRQILPYLIALIASHLIVVPAIVLLVVRGTIESYTLTILLCILQLLINGTIVTAVARIPPGGYIRKNK